MNKDPSKIQHAEKELSQLYSSLEAPEPTDATDDAILHFAKQRTLAKTVPASKPKINWTGGFSVAASIFAVSVIYWTQFAPSGDIASTPAQEVVISVDSAANLTPFADTGVAMPAEEALQAQAKRELKSAKIAAPTSALERETESATQREIALNRGAKSPESDSMGLENVMATASVVGSVRQENSQPVTAQADKEQSASELVESMKSRLMEGRLKQSVRLTAKCRVSVDSGYKLSNTPLGSVTENWNRADKIWLTEQLNSFTPPATMRASYQGNAPEVLNIDGFDTAYQKTIDSLKNCKEPHDPTR